MRLTRADLDRVDLEPLRPYVASPDEFFGRREHYRLLAALSLKIPPTETIFDIGTHLGDSALALSIGGATVESFDVGARAYGRPHPPNVFHNICDLWCGEARAAWRYTLLKSALICIDIDPHEGTRELELVEWLRANDYRGIIVLDDIWAFEGVRDNCWSHIPSEFKVDATSLGHHTGTGIVSFDTTVEPISLERPFDYGSVIVVSAYIPLPVKHLTGEQYRALGNRLANAALPNRLVTFEHPLEECWLYNEPVLPIETAVPVPLDRYASAADNIKSHIVQHNRTEWALRAAEMYPEARTVVWLDYGVMKQGAWRNNPIEDAHVRTFLDRIIEYPFERSMPFPGITCGEPIAPLGNNWRFCGSTHIWPVKWLPTIDRVYKSALRNFMRAYNRVPLDLTIWPEVEGRCAKEGPDHVPFQWYPAEYDASQLLGFPESERP
jgi:hypothetical protein